MEESTKSKAFLQELKVFLATVHSTDASELEWEQGEYGFKITLGVPKREQNSLPATNGKKESPHQVLRVVSPVVGTFHFFEEEMHAGSPIKVKEALGFVSSVNVEHKIEAEVEGKLSEIHVQEGEPVEFGQVLFTLEVSPVS